MRRFFMSFFNISILYRGLRGGLPSPFVKNTHYHPRGNYFLEDNPPWTPYSRSGISQQSQNGSISIAILIFTLTLTTLLGILVLSIKQTNTTLIHYQRYLQYYYNADATLKLAITRLTDIPTRDELPTKTWCYENDKKGLEINPFGHSKVYLFRYLNTIIAISQTAPERLILLGKLNNTQQRYLYVYAYD